MPYVLEYIWLDNDSEFRSKTKVIESFDFTVNSLPVWNYDGSSTGQAIGTDSEIMIKPVFICADPLRKTVFPSFLVLCETYDKEMKPLKNNYRIFATETLKSFKNQEPWFGLEQEYFIINPETKLPIGFEKGTPEPQGKYYCGVGSGRAIGRKVADEHLECCLSAGLKIGGINAEVAPAQWEFQIGPLDNVEVGDHLLVARYILNRIAEKYGYNISYHPKPLGVDADWNGSGCHVNFSTKCMRADSGLKHINDGLEKLGEYHKLHIKSYGDDNEMRLSGKHETSNINSYTIGRANRGASIRIPNETMKNNKGYFEDRRPAANIDPYLVCSLILQGVNDDLHIVKNMRRESIDYII
jgi:glutamine synthetase